MGFGYKKFIIVYYNKVYILFTKETVMQKLSKKLKICLYSSVSVAILAAIFMSISVLTFYDASENYLERSFLPILSIILIVVGVLAAFVTVFVMIPKGELNGDTP